MGARPPGRERVSDHDHTGEGAAEAAANPRRVRARPLWAHVTALAAALLVPALIIIGLIAQRWVQAEQARMEERTATLNAHAVEQIDGFLGGQVAMLRALATSPAWRRATMPGSTARRGSWCACRGSRSCCAIRTAASG